MYRNNNICTIDLAVNISDIEAFLLQKYMEGVQIVFVTLKNILLGGITKGDIYRLLRKNNNDIHIIKLINKNIKRIVFINEEQVFKDAEKIFNVNKKIHNIPVVNESGELLFQIDRFSEDIIISREIENILNAAKVGAIKSFLESDNIKEIIIIGSCKKSLCHAEQIFYEYCGDLILEKNIKITIKDNIRELHIDDTNIKIISLNKIGLVYLNKINKFHYDVILSEELYPFAELKKIKKFSKDIISNFIEIFKYKRIDICVLNKYTSFLIELISSCNVKCSYIGRSTGYKDYFENDDTNIFDVFLFSDNEMGGGILRKRKYNQIN